ncbi:hypothetical protein K7432_014274 [Basidiobolus ranarum]|uniref:Cytochrome b561 domain-containing protein n=1 Tax=Basidiobolus ranarum TaxID=34480 RepID=A0ABR2VPU5_9FUNG
MSEHTSSTTSPLLGPTTVTENPSRFGLAYAGIQVLLLIFLIGVVGIVANAKWMLFSWHPILMSLCLVLISEAVLILQKTTSQTKPTAAIGHRYIMFGVGLLGVAGVSIIYINKAVNGKPHFTSWHGKLGLTAALLILGQILFGLTLHYFPNLFGNLGQARRLYKRHRLFGYFIFSLMWINSLLGTQADWMVSQFPKSWIWYPVIILILLGLWSRVKLSTLK